MNQKHVVFLTEHLSYGGAEVVLTEYLQGIDLSKFSVSLIIRDDLKEKNYLLKEVPAGIKVFHLFSNDEVTENLGKTGTSVFRKEFVNRVKNTLAGIDKNPKIIDFSPILDKVTPCFKSDNVTLWMHGDKSHMGFLERTKYYLRIRHYRKIVVLCEEMKVQFNQIFPRLNRKLVVIPNPFNLNRIRAGADNNLDLSASEQQLMNRKYVVSVARLVPGKDFHTVIHAAKILKDQGYKYSHYIIGDGDLRAELQSLIDSNDLNDTVHLLGAKKNPYPWIKNSLFFVHSAHREGFGLVIVEAMALGKAVIASRCPVGPTEILDDGNYGLLYKTEDKNALASHIATLLDNPNIANEFAVKSRHRADDFSVQNIMPRLYELLED